MAIDAEQARSNKLSSFWSFSHVSNEQHVFWHSQHGEKVAQQLLLVTRAQSGVVATNLAFMDSRNKDKLAGRRSVF